MLEAYVLIEVRMGFVNQAVRDLRQVAGVVSATAVTGPFDVIARVAVGDVDILGRLVQEGLQAAEGVTRTITCPVLHL